MNVNRVWVVAVLAVAATLVAGCQTTPVQEGAILGGALGAGAGAIIGNQVHHQTGEGALIGGLAGALTGAIVGDQIDKARQEGAASAARPVPETVVRGHYENRIVRAPSGETYEERVWVPDR